MCNVANCISEQLATYISKFSDRRLAEGKKLFTLMIHISSEVAMANVRIYFLLQICS